MRQNPKVEVLISTLRALEEEKRSLEMQAQKDENWRFELELVHKNITTVEAKIRAAM